MAFRDLLDGESTEVKGSGAKPWVVKRVGDDYSCNCPSWRNQGAPTNARTCKHIISVRGKEAEDARLAAAGPNAGKRPEVAAAEADAGRALRGDEKAALFGPKILLAQNWWDEEPDPTGWWMSEKLDGVRAYWDGTKFLSRQGNVYKAPAWFTADLPAHQLDGELWMGRGKFQQTLSIVRSSAAGPEWEQIQYVTFDMPHLTTPFEDRQAAMASAWGYYSMLPQRLAMTRHWLRLEQTKCMSTTHMLAELQRLVDLGGEGLMLREPGSLYEIGRSTTLLKVKRFHDAEAIVVGYTKGKGKNKGKVGSLEMRMPNGKQFDLNAKTEELRRNPPPVGATVTYRYTELTDGGIPKCTSYVAVRDGY